MVHSEGEGMKRKILEYGWNAIGMAAVGAAVGCAVNGQWAASAGLAVLGVIALICWGIVDALESD